MIRKIKLREAFTIMLAEPKVHEKIGLTLIALYAKRVRINKHGQYPKIANMKRMLYLAGWVESNHYWSEEGKNEL
jgi:hypothetical protein